VLLGEPPRTQYDLNFSLLGIPVRVHPLFWLVALIMGSNRTGVPSVLSWVAAVFLSITVHELGHALAMRAHGFRPWIVLYGLGGVTACDQGDISRRDSQPLGQFLISLAGPLAGFLLATLLVLGVALAGFGQRIFFVDPWGLMPVVLLPNLRATLLLNDILFICIIWGVVNLLPVYPLDGGQIARELLLMLNPREGIRWSLWLSVVAAAGMAAFGLLQWQSWFVAFFFGYLAYTSYATLQVYNSHRPW
jgi:stage IV sporulation protein FB